MLQPPLKIYQAGLAQEPNLKDVDKIIISGHVKNNPSPAKFPKLFW